MEIGNISSGKITDEDFPFFLEVIRDSADWEKEEKFENNLSNYMARYRELNGEWRIWRVKGERIAVTYHLDLSPSNRKPWLGTILVKKEMRRKGIGTEVIKLLAAELKKKGEKSFFAGVPDYRNSWVNFLADAGFEQFKIETSDNGQMFLIMVLPLI
ncbi:MULTISPECIES: GNAT family N-acetyltransferase [unclassified Cytobacillus]|uniref:GNAT family N-acetyltransferase n=1 Tax=unclassified Cytobacillus TaxID=2675268 RepID=UPI00203D7FD6|nr:GNAT family N-acetyltransferase [Cytobacillus sp. AMY 15.2]MCM3094441.1 GNAT family N-acetyltransferase [Cytobacillus sp. AMY 15.2]